MKVDNFYRLEYSDYSLHHNGFLQMFHIELGSQHKTMNWTLYLFHGVDRSNSVNNDQIQMLSYF